MRRGACSCYCYHITSLTHITMSHWSLSAYDNSNNDANHSTSMMVAKIGQSMCDLAPNLAGSAFRSLRRTPGVTDSCLLLSRGALPDVEGIALRSLLWRITFCGNCHWWQLWCFLWPHSGTGTKDLRLLYPQRTKRAPFSQWLCNGMHGSLLCMLWMCSLLQTCWLFYWETQMMFYIHFHSQIHKSDICPLL